MAQLQRYSVAGYEAFVKFMQELSVPADQPVNVIFSGAKDEATGTSWCPDCVIAEPIIEKALERIPEQIVSHFVYVDVGDREFWKDTKNPFRLDKDTHLSVIPTLIRWKQPQRLEGDQLLKDDLLDMFFGDEED